jgi:hypothetical protein
MDGPTGWVCRSNAHPIHHPPSGAHGSHQRE